MSKMSDKKYLTPEQVADYFGISSGFVYHAWKKWNANGVRCLKVGKKVKIHIEQLEDYLTV